MKNNKFENGKGTRSIIVRVSSNQHQRLKALSEASGFKTLSDYIRINLLNPSLESKLNSILELLQENKIKEDFKKE